MIRTAHIAALGSLGLLLGAYAFQHLGGLAPCKMCLWQRWPHAAAILIGALLFFVPSRWLLWLGAAAALTTAALGAYHSGVEQKWWPGPSSCSGNGLGGLSGDSLLDSNAANTIIMCDEIAWAFAGLSMPTWNAVISFALAVLWIKAALKAA
ncbi:disulfide bond formation protein B [Nereida sp. MMG025]|uniref:disulfide bond formation protein B n=1 Tax=Nereida sp. MMG025 TaxID=2909981 RepID=UPI00351CE892|nr:disulfide bond formation protein B [Nereida sp. MMG025]